MTGGAGRIVDEVPADGAIPLWVQPEWAERFPWLIQGTTGRGRDEQDFDLGLSGAQPVGVVLDRWRSLIVATGARLAVHARQVHGTEVRVHRPEAAAGVLVMDGFDGHATGREGVLLSVGVADCVPVSVVAPGPRAVALLHAGWRGTAAGILERGIRLLIAEFGATVGELWLHCGPSICGACYEVGPEVHAAVRPDEPPPASKLPIDLRAALLRRAGSAGVPEAQVTTSGHCTRCGPPHFFSHRAGSSGRQMGVLGIRPRG